MFHGCRSVSLADVFFGFPCVILSFDSSPKFPDDLVIFKPVARCFCRISSFSWSVSGDVFEFHFISPNHVRCLTPRLRHGGPFLASLLQPICRRKRRDWCTYGPCIRNIPNYISPELCSSCGRNDHSSFYHWKYYGTIQSYGSLPTRTIFHGANGSQSPSRSTHTMENAGNFGSMRSTATDSAAFEDLSIAFTGLLDIIRCLFDFLITGINFLTFHSKMEDLLMLILRTINFLRPRRFPHWHLNCLIRVLPPLLLPRSPVASLRTSCRLSLRHFRLWHLGTLLILVLLRQCRTWVNEKPCCGTVCMCVRNIVKLLFVISLNQAGGSSTTASLLPTKTLAIGADTRPDQSGVPALIFTAMAWGQAKNPAMIHFLRFVRLPQSGIYLIYLSYFIVMAEG